MLHYIKYEVKEKLKYLSFFVFSWGPLAILQERDNNHFVWGPSKPSLSCFNGGRVINSDLSGQSERSLVYLIILLSHNSFHEGKTMLNV